MERAALAGGVTHKEHAGCISRTVIRIEILLNANAVLARRERRGALGALNSAKPAVY